MLRGRGQAARGSAVPTGPGEAATAGPGRQGSARPNHLRHCSSVITLSLRGPSWREGTGRLLKLICCVALTAPRGCPAEGVCLLVSTPRPPQSLLRPVPSHRTSTQTWAWLPPGRMSPSTCGGCSASPRCPECPQPVGAGSHPQPADFPRPRRGWPPQGPCGRRQVGGRRLNTSWREGQARPPPGPLTPRALCARELPPPFLGRQTGERCGSQRLGGPRCGGARPGPQCEGRVDSQLGSRDSPRDGDVVGEVHPGRDGAGQARGRAQRSSLAAGHAPQQPRPAAAGRETGLRLGGRRFLCHVPRTP